MDLETQADSVDSYEKLAEFIQQLELDFQTNGATWENQNLEFFLNAMSRWVGSIRQLHKNLGEELSPQPSWSFIASMLLVARDYE